MLAFESQEVEILEFMKVNETSTAVLARRTKYADATASLYEARVDAGILAEVDDSEEASDRHEQ